jgi:hypothetical protein
MEKDEKILQRIKNLLEMAGDSSSPHEAMIAAKRARSLMDKHQISKDDLLANISNSYGQADGEYSPKYTPTWVRIIAAAVGHLNDCQSIIEYTGQRITFRFRGFKSDAIIAKYTHDYLIATSERLLIKSGIKGRSNKNFYRLGFAQEISRRIAKIVTDRKTTIRTSDGRSLVILKKDLVDAHFDTLKKAREPNTRNPSLEESLAAIKGERDAKNVSFNQQLKSNNLAAISNQGGL